MTQPLARTIAIIEEGISAGLHLGAQVYVSLRGEAIFDDGIGRSRADVPMRADTISHWLSSGKPITATAIGQLWERGRLALDDRVARHIPEFGIARKEAITIRHILTHTAGFRGAAGFETDRPVDAILRDIFAMPLEPGWKPGVTAGYHGATSWFVLGEIVRRIDGRPLERYVREEIFLPLGMADSWIGMSGEAYVSYAEENRVGSMYPTAVQPPDPARPIPGEQECAQASPGGNYRGPAKDLGAFYESLLRAIIATSVPGPRADGTFLRAQTVEAMAARHRTGAFDCTFQHKIDFGLGFIVNSNLYGIETVPYGYGRHASPRAFGHSGAQSSCAFCDPEHQLVVAWHCNGMPGEPKHQKRQRAINSAIYEDLGLALP